MVLHIITLAIILLWVVEKKMATKNFTARFRKSAAKQQSLCYIFNRKLLEVYCLKIVVLNFLITLLPWQIFNHIVLNLLYCLIIILLLLPYNFNAHFLHYCINVLRPPNITNMCLQPVKKKRVKYGWYKSIPISTISVESLKSLVLFISNKKQDIHIEIEKKLFFEKKKK